MTTVVYYTVAHEGVGKAASPTVMIVDVLVTGKSRRGCNCIGIHDLNAALGEGFLKAAGKIATKIKKKMLEKIKIKNKK